jgi:NADH dehydrogenase [ubiquinone] 1 alpha subcomplex assembly factor 5
MIGLVTRAKIPDGLAIAILSRNAQPGTSPPMEAEANMQSKPFDRALRRVRRDRALRGWADNGFLQDHMAVELIERLQSVQRDFSNALILGFAGDALPNALQAMEISTVTADAGFALARAAGGIQCDEDRLPFADGSFDLVIAVGTLDTVNDLPGALRLIRQSLLPDGLFLGTFLGSGSLPVLRTAMLQADMIADRAAPRIHPQIDIRSAGDLLGRAGFALQVADGESLQVRYPSLSKLVADLRGSANTSLLEAPPLSRRGLAAAHAAFDAVQVDGKTAETFEIIYLTGWAPAPDQPKPAARGSGTSSLADALKSPR